MTTPKPLRLAVTAEVADEAWCKALENQGHIIVVHDFSEYDLVLASNASRYLPGMAPFMPAILMTARRLRYPVKPKPKPAQEEP